MKIRIKGNAIRLRLTISEVNTLSNGNEIVEQCMIGTTALIFTLKPSQIDNIDALMDDNKLTIMVNENWAYNWPHNEQVTIEAQILNQDRSILTITIEKDFACLDRPDEDQSDYYDHPAKQC